MKTVFITLGVLVLIAAICIIGLKVRNKGSYYQGGVKYGTRSCSPDGFVVVAGPVNRKTTERCKCDTPGINMEHIVGYKEECTFVLPESPNRP